MFGCDGGVRKYASEWLASKEKYASSGKNKKGMKE